MKRFPLAAPLLLLILVQFGASHARLDRCNHESRIRISRRYSHAHCSDERAKRSKSLLIDVPRIHGNPYHALYEVAWAVSYYLQNCLGRPHWQFDASNTFLRVQVNYEMNLTRCGVEPSDDEYQRWEQPSWGSCMLLAVAKRAGMPLSHVEVVRHDSVRSACHTAVVEFPPRFRSLTYEVGERPQVQKRQPKQYLHANKVDRTLHRMRRDVFKAFNVRPDTGARDKVHVLMYDRRDRRPYPLKRKWLAAEGLAKRLRRRDERVVVTHVSELPKSLAAQARLFHSADIVVAPHGAAMANTVFMRPGSHVFEIWKCCRDEVRVQPDVPQRWTGWHAARVGLKLSYVQCQRPNRTLNVWELKQLNARDGGDGAGADRWCSLPWVEVETEGAYRDVARAVDEQWARKRARRLRARLLTARAGAALQLGALAALLTALLVRRRRQRRALDGSTRAEKRRHAEHAL